MHRTIALAVSPEHTQELLQRLQREKFVLTLTIDRGAAVKPPGDVITITALNRGTDQILRTVQESAGRGGGMTVVTSRADSISTPGQQALIDSDVDEGIWEEMESGLVHHGRLTGNYVLLMGLGGAIAGAGLFADTVDKTIAFVAASIIAPGYEPVAKLPLALVLRRWPIVRHAIVSVAVGYAVLIASAAATLIALQSIGGVQLWSVGSVDSVRHLNDPGFAGLLTSACAAAAGALMIASFRETVLAGPLIALALVPASAILGGALAGWQPAIAWGAAKRLSVDMTLVVLLGYAVFWCKQRFTHRRMPII